MVGVVNLTKEQNKNILVAPKEETQLMPAFLKDTVAFAAVVSFIATVGLWSDLIRSLG